MRPRIYNSGELKDVGAPALPEGGTVNTVGQGRVFYEALGHHESIYYNNPDMLAHILAGMQYVLGDLKADDTPSRKKS